MSQKFTSNEIWMMVATIDNAFNHLTDCDEWNEDLQAATDLLNEARKNACRAAKKVGDRYSEELLRALEVTK